LAYTRVQRRQLRQMARLGLIVPHILYEVAVVHAPAIAQPLGDEAGVELPTGKAGFDLLPAAKAAVFDPRAGSR
jgi:hypothetical protein